MAKLFIILVFSLFLATALASLSGLRIDGNQIKTENGNTIQLIGMNRQGTEYACVQHGTIFSGPFDGDSIDTMKSWGPINTVRIPINEDCWLGLHGVNASVSGQNYKDAIYNYVNLLNSKGLYAIVDLHWTSDGTNLATGQQPMPNQASSTLVWADLADLFKDNTAVIFDLFNEPAPDYNAWNSPAAWGCWKNGGYCNGITYQTVGSQAMVDLVRGRGAKNILMVGGVQYTTSLVSWLDYKPTDPMNNIAASLHAYDFNYCRSSGCWDAYLPRVAAQVPLIVGEVGEIDCDTAFVNDFLPYALNHGFHPMAFSWINGGCKDPSLIVDFDGTPSVEGMGFKNFLQSVSKGEKVESPQTVAVFTDRMGHWMDDWSDGKHNISDDTVAHTGSISVSFWPEVSSDKIHFWCWLCVDTTIHRGIEFYYNGGSGPYTGLSVVIVSTDQEAKTTTIVGQAVPFSDIISAKANSWSKGYVSMDKFKLPKDGKYDGFMFVVNDPKQVEVFFDDIYVRAYSDSSASSILSPRGVSVVIFSLIVALLSIAL